MCLNVNLVFAVSIGVYLPPVKSQNKIFERNFGENGEILGLRLISVQIKVR